MTGGDLQVTAQESQLLVVDGKYVHSYLLSMRNMTDGLQSPCYDPLKITANLLIKCKFSSRYFQMAENVDTCSLVMNN